MTGKSIASKPDFPRPETRARNAIQVKNISRVQVGHIPRGVAAKLAPLMDAKQITVEGVINDGNRAYHPKLLYQVGL